MNKQIILSPEQIDILFSFVKSKYVRYVDVQHEIVDHLASAIEDEMSQDSSCSFDQALSIVYSRFPITGFSSWVANKETEIHRYWTRKVIKFLVQYFRIPKVLLTILVFILTYWIVFTFGKTSIYLIALLIFGLSIYNFIKYRHLVKGIKNESSYLFLSAFSGFGSGVGIGYLSFFLTDIIFNFGSHNSEPMSIGQTVILGIFFTCNFIYFHASITALPGMLRQEVNEKYKHLGLVI